MATRPGDGWADRVRQHYAFTEPAVDLGNLVVDGDDADTCVRIPLPALARHGLVTGAKGTGKTTTLRLMAEGLSAAGVPTVLVDMDGDVADVAQLHTLGEKGDASPVRAPVREFGPELLGMVLGLDDMQADALHQVFDFAAEQERPLVELTDLRAVLEDLAADSEALERVGGASAAAVGAIARALSSLAEHGAETFFGEPAIDAAELLRTDDNDAGAVSVLVLPDVTGRPVLSAALLLWLVNGLAAKVPEVTDGPTIAVLVDDAQLLFDGASKDLVMSVRQTLRSIRARRIGVFLAAGDPLDLHPHILRQLRNRIQHACTGAGDAVDALDGAAPASVPSPYELGDLLPELGTGEAVVTVLSTTGAPTPLAWTRVRAPGPLVANLDRSKQQQMLTTSPQEHAELRARPAGRRTSPTQHSAEQTRPDVAAAPPAPATASNGLGDASGSAISSPVFKSYARSAASAASREIAHKLFGAGPRSKGDS